MQLGQLEEHSTFKLGGVNYLLLPTTELKKQQLHVVDVLKLVDGGKKKELSSSVEVEVSMSKNEMTIASIRILQDAIHAL